MPRKKSASKKAREAEANLAQQHGVPQDGAAEGKATDEQALAGTDQEEEQDSSDSEVEDEYGELLTQNVEEQIQTVLHAIKEDPKKLLDPNAKFFDDAEVELSKGPRDKPLYLKDYHRMNLLSGGYKDDEDNEFGTVDGEKPFVVAEREEREKLLEDIDNAFKGSEGGSDSEDEDGFLKKKKAEPQPKEAQDPMALVDPNTNAEEFLSLYLKNEAWIPKKNDKVINLDQMDNEDEQDFDDAVEDFERAYNFRFEDPNAAEIVSYARNQATLRRGKTNARKRAREKNHAIKEKEKQEIEQEVQKKKTQKINKVMDRLSRIKEAVGGDIADERIERVFGDSLLNDDFDDADWDGKMAEIFNDQYYESEMGKPEWGEDDELMAEFHDEQKSKNKDESGMSGDAQQEPGEEAEPITKKKKALKEKKSAKKEKESLKEKAQSLVEANALKIRDEVEEERGRAAGKSDEVRFKYREVSPESYGLSTREIFLADDRDLNKYFSIKKFAPYKPKEQALKDKRRYTKSKHLKQWRHEVFRNKYGPPRQEKEGENEIWIPAEHEAPARKKAKKLKKQDK